LVQDDGGERVVREPKFHFEDDAVILPVLITEADEPGRSVGGSTSVVYFQQTDRQLQNHTVDSSGSVEVKLNVSTTERRAELWQDALEDEMDSCSISWDDTVECESVMNLYGSLVFRQTDVTY
jgi:hypothetical protein